MILKALCWKNTFLKIENFLLNVSFHIFACAYGKLTKHWTMDFVIKILFDIWEVLGEWRAFQNMRRWARRAFEKGLNVVRLDMYSLTYPNCRHLSHASTQGSIMVQCALTAAVDPGFVISVYDTVHWSPLRKPAWLLKESTSRRWAPAQHWNRGLFIQAVK